MGLLMLVGAVVVGAATGLVLDQGLLHPAVVSALGALVYMTIGASALCIGMWVWLKSLTKV